MKTNYMILIFIVLLPFTGSPQCSPLPANIVSFTYNGNNYEIIKEKLNWVNAAGCAVYRGGKLAEINSLQEQDSLFFRVGTAGIIASNTTAPDGGGAAYLWIGGNDLATEGTWVWDGDNTGNSVPFYQGTYPTGTAVGGLFNNWGNEPDNFNGIQDGLGFAFTAWPLGVAGEWNDLNVANQLYFIIEYDNTSSINENGTTAISVFPNPCTDFITISLQGLIKGSWKVQISNTAGQVLISQKMCNSNERITLESLPGSGIYYVQVTDDGGNLVLKQKLIRQ
jgi:hypothetical protein